MYTGIQKYKPHTQKEREIVNLTKDQINVAISKAFYMHKKDDKD